MAEKETKSCSDCIHFDVCYKIEHFGRDLEDTSPCEQFIDKNVEPVRHGHWKQVDDTKCKCSECEAIAYIAQYPPSADKNYCPNCGAKMDGGEGE